MLLPPFFGGLMAYDSEANIAFDCPGHQGGQFYRKSPAGQIFFKYFGGQREGVARVALGAGGKGAGPGRASSTLEWIGMTGWLASTRASTGSLEGRLMATGSGRARRAAPSGL